MMADYSFPQIGDVDLVEVYEFCDEPVLFSCGDRTDLLYLAVLSNETASHKTWLLPALSARRFSQLRAGVLDLHSAFADAERGQVYRARLPRTPDAIPTVEWVSSADLSKEELPVEGELYELLLKYGLDLAIPVETRDIEGCTISVIGAGALVVCLSDDISLDVVSGIAALKDELQPEIMRVVFKDSGFADDVVKTNAVQILKQAGIDDVKSL
jgi:Family of unknown function (DUF6575)